MMYLILWLCLWCKGWGSYMWREHMLLGSFLLYYLGWFFIAPLWRTEINPSLHPPRWKSRVVTLDRFILFPWFTWYDYAKDRNRYCKIWSLNCYLLYLGSVLLAASLRSCQKNWALVAYLLDVDCFLWLACTCSLLLLLLPNDLAAGGLLPMLFYWIMRCSCCSSYCTVAATVVLDILARLRCVWDTTSTAAGVWLLYWCCMVDSTWHACVV
jgi:hypothetical protein